ncbi:MAG: hypothetical protein AAFU85_02690 [Planctomycetota bacterium]
MSVPSQVLGNALDHVPLQSRRVWDAGSRKVIGEIVTDNDFAAPLGRECGDGKPLDHDRNPLDHDAASPKAEGR